MGHLERLHRFDEPEMNEHEKLSTVKREMLREWQEYKRHQWIMHGKEIEDNRLDMLLLYLIKRGLV